MRIIFFGNTSYSLIGAKILHEKLGIAFIVTINDRPDKKGRLIPSPLKSFALEQNIPFLTSNTLNESTISKIKALRPDFFVVEDYGLILPEDILNVPNYAPLNVHHSLLPKYRGPAPAPFAILAGEKISGVSIIRMSSKVDAGDIYAQKKYTLKTSETTDSLLKELNKLGGELTVDVINAIVTKKITPKKQPDAQASQTSFMKKSDSFIDLENPPDAIRLDRMIRAYYPWPVVWTRLSLHPGGGRLQRSGSHDSPGVSGIETQKIIKFLPEKNIQMEGKNPVTVKDFINGYPEMHDVIKKILS